jgi:hypothetical protein
MSKLLIKRVNATSRVINCKNDQRKVSATFGDRFVKTTKDDEKEEHKTNWLINENYPNK